MNYARGGWVGRGAANAFRTRPISASIDIFGFHFFLREGTLTWSFKNVRGRQTEALHFPRNKNNKGRILDSGCLLVVGDDATTSWFLYVCSLSFSPSIAHDFQEALLALSLYLSLLLPPFLPPLLASNSVSVEEGSCGRGHELFSSRWELPEGKRGLEKWWKGWKGGGGGWRGRKKIILLFSILWRSFSVSSEACKHTHTQEEKGKTEKYSFLIEIFDLKKRAINGFRRKRRFTITPPKVVLYY